MVKAKKLRRKKKEPAKRRNNKSLLDLQIMKFLVRLLLLFVFLLACMQGLILLGIVTSNPIPESRNLSMQFIDEIPVVRPSAASVALSKLGLTPFFTSKRTLATVMVENHEDARPFQEGLDRALIVQEWPVEGMISRFAAIFDIKDLPKRIGPVRSLRPYFLESILPWETVVFHAGGSPEALDKIYGSSKLTSINGIAGAYWELFDRNEDSVPPHDLFVNKDIITTYTRNEDPEPVAWPPYTEGKALPALAVNEININFFSPLHNVHYTYNPYAQHYMRTNGNVIRQAFPRNVLILEVPIVSTGEYGRLNMPIIGNGRAYLFRSGYMYEGRWKKNGEFSEFEFVDLNYNPLIFAHGQTWITAVPNINNVSWEDIVEEEV